jgi:dephospho-CoA kinase
MEQKEKQLKLLLVGASKWGKDTFAEILNEEFGLKYQSSSVAAARIFLFNQLKEKYGYETFEECFIDRHNHRAEWFNAISEYNKDDKARLAKEILKDSNVYVGMRNSEEIEECMKQGLFDLIIWVDASERLPMEDASSFNIDKTYADVIIENNTTYESFREKTIRFGKIFLNQSIEKIDIVDYINNK